MINDYLLEISSFFIVLISLRRFSPYATIFWLPAELWTIIRGHVTMQNRCIPPFSTYQSRFMYKMEDRSFGKIDGLARMRDEFILY